MNISRIYIFCLLIASMPLMACQPGGKCCAHYDRRLSKHDLRVGPDQRQKRKQDLWEMVQAKRIQKGQKLQKSTDKLAACYEAYSKLLAQAIASQPTGGHAHYSTRPTSCSHPFMAAALFTLMFIVPCAESSGQFYYPVCESCVFQQRQVEEYYKLRTDFINKYGLKISYPAPDIHCPGYTPKGWPGPWGSYKVLEDCNTHYDRGGARYAEYERKDRDELPGAIAQRNQEIEQHNQQIKDENDRAITHNQVVAVNQYMDGRYYNLKPEYEKSLHTFSKDPRAFVSRSKEELEADPLIKLGEITQNYVKSIKPSDVTVHYTNLPWNRESRFVELMRSESTFIEVAQNITKELATGEYSPEIKAHAQGVVEAIQKKLIQPPQLAREVDYLIDQTKNNGIDRIHLEARLNELSLGFLHTADKLSYCTYDFCSHRPTEISIQCSGKSCAPFLAGTRILCSSAGQCGISDAIAAQLGGAKTDFALIDKQLKNLYVQIHSAQDVRRIFMYQGGYVGRPYIGTGPVNPLIRSMEGGQPTASKVFNFCARGNEITESYSPKLNAQVYKLTLVDGTKVTYCPMNKNGESVITITDMPAWISQDTIEFRFIN